LKGDLGISLISTAWDIFLRMSEVGVKFQFHLQGRDHLKGKGRLKILKLENGMEEKTSNTSKNFYEGHV